MLKHLIPRVPFKLQTDASDRGIAGILYQSTDDEEHNIIGIVSRCLSPTEIKYTTTEKELLAVVYSVEKFRVYLLGVQFEIVTNHKNLTFLQSARFLSARITRWILLLQQYSFSVSHCRGVDNVVADFFSRYPDGKFRDNDDVKRIVISSMHRCFSPATKGEASLAVIALIRYNVGLARSLKTLSGRQRGHPKIRRSIDAYDEMGRIITLWCIRIFYSIEKGRVKIGEL